MEIMIKLYRGRHFGEDFVSKLYSRQECLKKLFFLTFLTVDHTALADRAFNIQDLTFGIAFQNLSGSLSTFQLSCQL